MIVRTLASIRPAPVRSVVVTCLVAVMLAGCGEAPAETDRGGAEVDASVAVERSTDLDLPYGFTLYPGAQVVTTSTIAAADGSGVLVVMASADPPDALLAYYRAQAERAGIAITQEQTAGEQVLIGGEGTDGVSVVFSASAMSDGSIAQLVVGRGAI